MLRHSRFSALALPAITAALTGCALTATAPPTAVSAAVLSGVVRGGQQPIVGAHIYLYAANTAGYNTTAATYSSVSLLTSVAGSTTKDANGNYYVTTGANGGWTITGDYTCTPDSGSIPGQQAYLYAVGGTQGGVANTGASLMAVLGDCPAADNYLSTAPNININEVTTVAAAYAMAGFAYDATHVSSSATTLAKTGVKNAFANAGNLVNLASGSANATTPAGNGTVPQATIYTLANILAACINTNGSVTGPASATSCYTLFYNAKSGGSTGTVPSETATAAINIAHNPANAVSILYSLPVPSPPFANGLTSQTPPNDFTLAVNFSGSNLYDLGVDATGYVYGLAESNNAVVQTTNLGVMSNLTIGPLNYQAFAFGSQISPSAMVLGGGGVWLTTGYTTYYSDNASTPCCQNPSSFYYSGAGAVHYSFATTYGPGSIDSFCELTGYTSPVEGSGGLYTIYANGSGIELNETANCSSPNYFMEESGVDVVQQPGAPSTATGPSGTSASNYIASTPKGVIWVSDYGGLSSFTGVTNTTNSSYNSHPTGGGLTNPGPIAIDANSNVWVAEGSSLVEFITSGTYGTSGSFANASGFTGGGLPTGNSYGNSIAIDGAGNVWVGGTVLSVFSNAGTALSPSTGLAPATSLGSVVIDGSGDVWGSANGGLVELIGAAVPVITPIASGVGTRP